MSVLELKGGLIELIAKINDKELLAQLYQITIEAVNENMDQTDFWDDLNAEQKKELDLAIEESQDEGNWVLHTEVISKFEKWLNK